MISLRTTSRRLLGALLVTLTTVLTAAVATAGPAAAQVPKDPPGGAGTTVLPIPVPVETGSHGVAIWTVVLVAALAAAVAAATAAVVTQLRASHHARTALAI